MKKCGQSDSGKERPPESATVPESSKGWTPPAVRAAGVKVSVPASMSTVSAGKIRV